MVNRIPACARDACLGLRTSFRCWHITSSGAELGLVVDEVQLSRLDEVLDELASARCDGNGRRRESILISNSPRIWRTERVSTLMPERWRELSPYLDEALSLEGDERARWLEALRVKNPEFADSLQKLLKEHVQLALEHFLDRGDAIAEDRSLGGQIVGAYRVISRIGQGG